MSRRLATVFVSVTAVWVVLALSFAPASSRAQPKEKKEGNEAQTKAAEKKDKAPRAGKRQSPKKAPGKEKLFDFTALKLDGSTRMPQLLYFLERASAELERASLKRRSFVPEMIRSMDEDAL